MAYRRGGRPGLDFSEKSEDSTDSDLGLENDRLPIKYRRRADKVFESMLSDMHEKVEERLQETGFMSREEEEKAIEFGRAYRKLRNLDSHWKAARESKPHNEIEEDDLDQLNGIIREVERSARLELKFTCYLSLMLEQISETEVEPEDIEGLEGKEEKEKKRVGDYIGEASEEAEPGSRDREIIASEVNRRLGEEEEQIKAEIREEEQLLERYERCLKLLEGIKKELEAIEDAKEETETHRVKRNVRRSFGHLRVTIAEREELADRIERAEGARKAISKAFFNGMLR